jgi:hypothetical protein
MAREQYVQDRLAELNVRQLLHVRSCALLLRGATSSAVKPCRNPREHMLHISCLSVPSNSTKRTLE